MHLQAEGVFLFFSSAVFTIKLVCPTAVHLVGSASELVWLTLAAWPQEQGGRLRASWLTAYGEINLSWSHCTQGQSCMWFCCLFETAFAITSHLNAREGLLGWIQAQEGPSQNPLVKVGAVVSWQNWKYPWMGMLNFCTTSLFNFLSRGSGEGGTELFSLVTGDRTQGNGTKQHQGRFGLDTLGNVSLLWWLSDTGTGFLTRWLMSCACQCSSGIWKMSLLKCVHFWLALKWLGGWTQWSLKINDAIPSKLFCSV